MIMIMTSQAVPAHLPGTLMVPLALPVLLLVNKIQVYQNCKMTYLYVDFSELGWAHH
jgi:hypothetical protein